MSTIRVHGSCGEASVPRGRGVAWRKLDRGGRFARALRELGLRRTCTGTGVGGPGRPNPVSKGHGAMLGRQGRRGFSYSNADSQKSKINKSTH